VFRLSEHLSNDFGFDLRSNMLTGGCEVQAEQPSGPPAHPVRFRPLLERRPPAIYAVDVHTSLAYLRSW
jgi:hypothetical protein